MKLIINNENINFTLENEKNLGEVIEGINKWLRGSGFNITELKIDNETLDLDKEENWKQKSIETIGTLSVNVKHISELRVANLETVLQYLELLERAIQEKNLNLYSDLMTGFPFMIESLKNNFLTDTGMEINNPEEEILNPIPIEEINHLEEKDKNEYIAKIERIKTSLTVAIKDIENPKETLNTLAEELKRASEGISEVSILLQTGRDREAMENIIKFSNLTGRLFRILSSLSSSGLININELKIGNKNSREFYGELNSNLRELIEAFKTNDSVLIGDILEYEIAPRIEMLIALAREIQVS